jgi:hypothetical protein
VFDVGLPKSVNGMVPSNTCFLNVFTLASISSCVSPFKTSTKTSLKNLPSIGGKLDFWNSKPLISSVSFSTPSCLVIHCAYLLVALK